MQSQKNVWWKPTRHLVNLTWKVEVLCQRGRIVWAEKVPPQQANNGNPEGGHVVGMRREKLAGGAVVDVSNIFVCGVCKDFEFLHGPLLTCLLRRSEGPCLRGKQGQQGYAHAREQQQPGEQLPSEAAAPKLPERRESNAECATAACVGNRPLACGVVYRSFHLVSELRLCSAVLLTQPPRRFFLKLNSEVPLAATAKRIETEGARIKKRKNFLLAALSAKTATVL